jgi:ubiquinone/menaquinone biosynthesis C-methylase UbiE
MLSNEKLHHQMITLVHEKLYQYIRHPYLDLQEAGLQAGQKVLEIGCGPGFFSVPAAFIVGNQGRLVTIDVNPWAVKCTQEKIAAAGLNNADVLQLDAACTDLPAGSFDLVFVFGFRHPKGDLHPILQEIHRLLKDDGILAWEGTLQPPQTLFTHLDRNSRIVRYRKVRKQL